MLSDPAPNMGAGANQHPPRRRRRWWHITAAEARTHATMAGVVLWAIAAVNLLTGSGYRSAFGPLKGTDFIQFYTLAHLDAHTAPSVLYNPQAFHELQTQLVPESARERYLIVYPPHVALLFRPLAGMSYGAALFAWSLTIAIGYAACVWLAWRPSRTVISDKRLVVAAAAAFPPFWSLIQHGQTTIVPMAAFCLGWLALNRGRRFLAGAAFGLLLLKPHLALVLVPVVLFCREWAMLAGGAVSVATQLAVTAAVLGTSVLRDYMSVVANLRAVNALLEPKPGEMHSLSAITNQLPQFWGAAIWAVTAVFIVVQTIRVWRSDAPIAVRMACLVVASMLLSPHLFSYDVVVLALPLVWYAGWACRQMQSGVVERPVFAPLLYSLYLTLLAPTARMVPGVQASVVVIAAFFVILSRTALRQQVVVHVHQSGEAEARESQMSSALRAGASTTSSRQ